MFNRVVVIWNFKIINGRAKFSPSIRKTKVMNTKAYYISKDIPWTCKNINIKKKIIIMIKKDDILAIL